MTHFSDPLNELGTLVLLAKADFSTFQAAIHLSIFTTTREGHIRVLGYKSPINISVRRLKKPNLGVNSSVPFPVCLIRRCR